LAAKILVGTVRRSPIVIWIVCSSKFQFNYVNKIGNLTLVSKRINSKVQNGPVSQKISDYEISKVVMTEQLVQRLKDLEFKWGENEINQRQIELAVLAFKHVWSI
jgi:hypothetical protein